MTETAPTKTVYEVRRTLSLTKDMDERLQQILTKQERTVSLNDLTGKTLHSVDVKPA